MGDMGEMYQDWGKIKKDQKAVREKRNREVIRQWIEEDEEIDATHLFVEYRAHSILFRFPDKPKADFFPTTNKWRSGNRNFYGDARAFINWYKKQKD
jgi:hypothetical protein